MRKAIVSLIAAASIAVAACPRDLAAQQQGQRLSFIRDSEIENTIRLYAVPLFGAAGLDANAIRVHLVNDRQINAFVARGQNMFINTGLLMRAEHAGQVIGVIAHETGHIAGGHLSRTNEEIANSWYQMALAAGVGLAAALASGNAGAVMAGGALGMHLAERNFLAYSRAQESAADQAAFTFLERTGQSARGMAEFFEILADQELLSAGRQDPYVRSHPMTTQRVESVQSFLEKSRYANAPPRPEFAEMNKRVRAKLWGFLDPARAFQLYPEDKGDLDARYARSIAYFRRADLTRAVPLIDGLIAERPNDPYFHEMKGQMLFENGRGKESIGSYQKAADLLPDDPLLRTELAHAQLELGTPEPVKPAIVNLLHALRFDTQNTTTWRLLSIAYGRDGQEGMAALSAAEHALLQGRGLDARQFAARAERLLPQGSAAWLRSQDIKNAPKGPADERQRRDRR